MEVCNEDKRQSLLRIDMNALLCLDVNTGVNGTLTRYTSNNAYPPHQLCLPGDLPLAIVGTSLTCHLDSTFNCIHISQWFVVGCMQAHNAEAMWTFNQDWPPHGLKNLII